MLLEYQFRGDRDYVAVCTDTKSTTLCLYHTRSHPPLLRLEGLFLTSVLILSSQLLLLLKRRLVSAVPRADGSAGNGTDSSHHRLDPGRQGTGHHKHRCAECHHSVNLTKYEKLKTNKRHQRADKEPGAVLLGRLESRAQTAAF